ncbi:HAD family phosphatase [Streptomyces kaniharaensis]|uniref:HAD family phosphatase n=1 Tax=Streptomyces kaniharaensis TaxID=212423 RepID=A0A6N7L5H0_9ACTN|nr:HAD family phosphatase [Streptomyces kaniharaensis]MQS17614.1 HAD family phosphatase [Streptomyces kaniharaensis]
MSTGSQEPSCPGECGCVPALDKDIGALIVDFDGTLADTRQGHEDALHAALEPYGVVLDPTWYARHIGLSIRDLLAALPGGRALPHGEVIARSRAHLLAEVHTITPIACTVELLRRAQAAGLPCAVASGASQQLVGPGLDALGLRGAFEAVVAREDAARGKPHPELFLTAARRLGIAPGHCLAVDDAPDGVAAARAAGMRVLTIARAHLAPVISAPAGLRDCASRSTDAAGPLPAHDQIR